MFSLSFDGCVLNLTNGVEYRVPNRKDKVNLTFARKVIFFLTVEKLSRVKKRVTYLKGIGELSTVLLSVPKITVILSPYLRNFFFFWDNSSIY